MLPVAIAEEELFIGLLLQPSDVLIQTVEGDAHGLAHTDGRKSPVRHQGVCLTQRAGKKMSDETSVSPTWFYILEAFRFVVTFLAFPRSRFCVRTPSGYMF